MTASPMPPGLAQGFLVAATELGMVSAARLFVEETAIARGRAGVEALRDALGREFSVVDFVASSWLDGSPLPERDIGAIVAALEDPSRLLVVGMEADPLDRLVAALPRSMPIGLTLGGGGLEPDTDRAAANYGGRVVVVPISEWARWAGARSTLLTFVYGSNGHDAFVAPAFLRLVGPDVRTSFRALVGWDLLGRAPRLHPRYLAGASVRDFSTLLGPTDPARA